MIFFPLKIPRNAPSIQQKQRNCFRQDLQGKCVNFSLHWELEAQHYFEWDAIFPTHDLSKLYE